MNNRTRVMMPPPVANMKMTVKQRPGMNYPRPVNHVKVSEVNRAPFRLFGGTLPGRAECIHTPWTLGKHATKTCYERCVTRGATKAAGRRTGPLRRPDYRAVTKGACKSRAARPRNRTLDDDLTNFQLGARHCNSQRSQ